MHYFGGTPRKGGVRLSGPHRCCGMSILCAMILPLRRAGAAAAHQPALVLRGAGPASGLAGRSGSAPDGVKGW